MDDSCMDDECCEMKPMTKCIAGVLCVGALLVLVLIPMSFQGVEYYQVYIYIYYYYIYNVYKFSCNTCYAYDQWFIVQVASPLSRCIEL